MHNPRSRLLAVLALLTLSLTARAACVNPIVNPSAQTPRSAWNELINLKAPKTLNSAITLVQHLDTTGEGDMNLDYYAVTLNAAGQTAEQLLAQLRAGIEKYIYEGTEYKLSSYDAASKTKWDSNSPLGALMVFTLAGYSGVPFERGAVVVSCADATSFVFSTVQIGGVAEPGDHPVSGNRGFGVAKNPDGSLTMYTKAADRRKGDNVTFANMGSKKIFELGAAVWKGLVENIKRNFAARQPRDAFTYRRVVTYP